MQMISIIYSERDYEAANIALKVQSLSQNQKEKIYIVPKHFGRNSATVQQMLAKSKAAVFLAVDSKRVDDITFQELLFLRQNRKPIKYIVPNRYSLNDLQTKEVDVYRYYPNTTRNNLIRNISATISELEERANNSSNEGVLAAIILSALLLLGLSSTSSTKAAK